MHYVFFWVITQRLSSKSRRFGTLYRFHLQGQVDEEYQTSTSRTQTPGNYPKENILHTEHGESLKSRNGNYYNNNNNNNNKDNYL